MFALLSDGGCVVPAALALCGLQGVDVALQVDVTRGQRHVMRPVHFAVDLLRFVVESVGVETFAGLCRGGHVDDLDVGDAGLPQHQL